MKLEKGKKIFYENFGSSYFMQRNGELSEYKKCGINKADEEIWVEDIIKDIVQKIISGQNIGLIWNLSYMDISSNRRLLLYYEIKNKGDRERIKREIIVLKELFEETKYQELINVFG